MLCYSDSQEVTFKSSTPALGFRVRQQKRGASATLVVVAVVVLVGRRSFFLATRRCFCLNMRQVRGLFFCTASGVEYFLMKHCEEVACMPHLCAPTLWARLLSETLCAVCPASSYLEYDCRLTTMSASLTACNNLCLQKQPLSQICA